MKAQAKMVRYHYFENGKRVDCLLNSNEVAEICLSCPFPKCTNTGKCVRYKTEITKIKEKTYGRCV